MGDEVAVGRKEIVDYFKQLRLIKADTAYKPAWRTVLRHRINYGTGSMFYHYPNGMVYVIKREFEVWIAKQRQKEAAGN